MRTPYRYYDVGPHILRAGQPARIRVRALYDHVRFPSDQPVGLILQPIDRPTREALHLQVTAVDGCLEFEVILPAEGEYALLLNPERDENSRRFAEFRLYALEDDLFQRRPYKGDLHMHSNR